MSAVSDQCEAIIVKRPQDTVRFIGDTAVLRCSSNDSQQLMSWSRGRIRQKIVATSASGVVNSRYPRLSLNRSADGQFDLVIKSTQSGDADTYGCTVGFTIETAELVLLGTCFVSVSYELTTYFSYAYNIMAFT